jgi:hypothetical protein
LLSALLATRTLQLLLLLLLLRPFACFVCFALVALVCVCVCARSDGYPQSYQYHNYSGSPEEGVRDMLRAGLDVDCAFGSGIALDAQTVSSALRMGVITEADIETALEHLFMVRVQTNTTQNKTEQNRTTQCMLFVCTLC